MGYCIENIKYNPTKTVILYDNDVFDVDFNYTEEINDGVIITLDNLCFNFNTEKDIILIEVVNQNEPTIIENDKVLFIKIE